MPVPLCLVDAFTSEAFRGNPAAVCYLDEERSEEWMQKVALEMNQAETAFVQPTPHGFDLRWFTPAVEVDLCGHATLAAAHVLWAQGIATGDEPIRFDTRSGILYAAREDDRIVLDFPAEPVTEGFLPHVSSLFPNAVFTGSNRMDWFVALPTGEDVVAYEADLIGINYLGMRGIIVTGPSHLPDCDFVSRFFAPQAGVPEDSVTGSAHCALAPYWCGVLGPNRLTGYQASKRGGFVGVELAGDRVKLIGYATMVLKGNLLQ